MHRNVFFLTIVAAVLSIAACANPADGVPEAQVAEPAADAAAPAAAEGVAMPLDPSSTVTWVGSKVTGSHDGGFHAFEGEIVLVDGDPAQSSVHVVIDTNSLWSDNDRLTGHLKSADFFDVENHPQATFHSTSIAPAADGGYTVTGDLTLHGVTKSITFPATIEVVDGTVSAMAEFVLMRFDFDIVYPGKPDDLIRDEVVVRFDLKTAAPAAA